jgi:hypothetical protein
MNKAPTAKSENGFFMLHPLFFHALQGRELM